MRHDHEAKAGLSGHAFQQLLQRLDAAGGCSYPDDREQPPLTFSQERKVLRRRLRIHPVPPDPMAAGSRPCFREIEVFRNLSEKPGIHAFSPSRFNAFRTVLLHKPIVCDGDRRSGCRSGAEPAAG